MFAGNWENGLFQNGTWELKDSAVYEGNFKLGRPYGEGKFIHASGLTQKGTYEEKKTGEEEEPAEDEVPLPPNVTWKGESIVAI